MRHSLSNVFSQIPGESSSCSVDTESKSTCSSLGLCVGVSTGESLPDLQCLSRKLLEVEQSFFLLQNKLAGTVWCSIPLDERISTLQGMLSELIQKTSVLSTSLQVRCKLLLTSSVYHKCFLLYWMNCLFGQITRVKEVMSRWHMNEFLNQNHSLNWFQRLKTS